MVIFFCLRAKLQIFQEYRALLEKFFGGLSKKVCFSEAERLPKKFCKSRKIAFTQADRALQTVANMVAKIEIDALKIKKKSRTMRLKIGKQLKTASLNPRLPGSKTEQCTSTYHF